MKHDKGHILRVINNFQETRCPITSSFVVVISFINKMSNNINLKAISMFANNSKRRFKIFPVLIFLVGASLYYFSHQENVPITGRRQFVDIDPQTEAALGLQSYQQVLAQSELIRGTKESELVNLVGRRVANVVNDLRKFDWEFNIISSGEKNAFCLPGGKVAVYSGILPIAANEDGLAVIMAHEIGHALARHGAERMAQEKLFQFGQLALGVSVSDMDPQTSRSIMGAFGLGARFGVLLPFSREHESEADHIGLILMSRACFNPQEAPRLWERMSRASAESPPQFLSTHPNSNTRIQQFREWMPEALNERAKNCKEAPQKNVGFEML